MGSTGPNLMFTHVGSDGEHIRLTLMFTHVVMGSTGLNFKFTHVVMGSTGLILMFTHVIMGSTRLNLMFMLVCGALCLKLGPADWLPRHIAVLHQRIPGRGE